jgi:3-hydroxyisobutyrate dehydrogenase-like beta-hydroxyacid dehydrogenase
VSDVVVGLLHPGEMGAAVGRCLADGGHQVLWAPEGRSPATAARAESADLIASRMSELVRRSDIIVSVCPPHAALDVARQVAGFGGIYVDANAIAPATASEVAGVVEAGGAAYVDGGIIGPPPATPGHTRLYLSGARAGEVRQLFEGTAVDARVVDPDGAVASFGAVGPDGAIGSYGAVGSASAVGPYGAASAVKMAYASWTKGTAALVLEARALARAEGVEETLLAEWAMSQPGLADRSVGAARSAAAKGWRWIAEMEEIASAMAAVGLPGGFHEAAAEIYRRSAGASADAIVDALCGQQGPSRSDR